MRSVGRKTFRNKIMSEIYISTDVETDGPIPGDNSMLSLGAASFTADGTMLSTFYGTLENLLGALPHPATMKWWSENQTAYDETRKNTEYPSIVMKKYVDWVNSQPGKPVFVGYPAGFDFLFVYWYLMHFIGASPFSFSALDIKTYAMATMKSEYRKSTKKNMPKHWFPKDPHTHVAVDDAIEQGKLFCNMLKDNIK
jgi:3' exoribonuclease, RNase T-like